MGYRWGRGRPCDLGHCLVINKRSYICTCAGWPCAKGEDREEGIAMATSYLAIVSCPEIDISA